MSRKHFILIAQAIRESISDQAQREATARTLIAALQTANPNFNAELFLTACTGSKVQS